QALYPRCYHQAVRHVDCCRRGDPARPSLRCSGSVIPCRAYVPGFSAWECAMHRPILVVAPKMTPVSLDEAKAQLAVEHGDDDALILGYIAAAVDHLDGWSGILGRALVEQEWRQDFDGFSSTLRLPL